MDCTKILLLSAALLTLFGTTATAEDTLTIPDQWTVREAVNYALYNNPDVRIAEMRINEARALVTVAKSAYYPQVSISAGYTRTDTPMYSFGNILNQGQFTNSIDFNDPGITDDLSLAGHIQYRVYNGGRDKAGIQAAEAGEKANRYQQQAIYHQLGFAVVQSYYSIGQAMENIQAQESALIAIQASLQAARARFEAGDLLKADLLNLQVQESRASENLIRAKHALELAKRSFLNLLGLNQGQADIDTSLEQTQEIPQNPTCDQRPELAGIDAGIISAEAQLRKAQAGNYPTADFVASYQADKGYEYNEGSGNSWMAGIQLNYSLFDGQRTSAGIERARARLGQLTQQRHKMVLDFCYEIEQATLALQLASQRQKVTRKMVVQADESARLSRERFKEGLILAADLIEVERRLTDARVHNLTAKSARHIAIADLRRAAGLPQFNDSTDQNTQDL